VTRTAGHMVLTVPLVFLCHPHRPGARRVTHGDLALALLAVTAIGWIVVNQQRLMWRLVYVDPLSPADLVVGAAAVALVLEATRRIIGWALIVTTVVFLV
jgi:TRAP-type uncharacterized transport system fused permease subunit